MISNFAQRPRGSNIEIASRDYWFKVVDFLQKNWALIDPHEAGFIVWFLGDTSGVFDQLKFPTKIEADKALKRNGFRRFADDPEAQTLMRAPAPPFRYQPHPNGPIYSSGQFWK